MAKVSSFTQDYAKKREEQVRENGYERFGTQTYGLRDLAAQVRPAASQRPVTAEASTEPARNQTVRPEFADQGISNSRGDTRILTGEPLNLTREGQWAAKHPIAGTLMYGVSNLVGGAEGLINTGEAALRALATGQKFNPNNIHAAPIAQGFRTGAAEGFRREAQEEHPRISSAIGIDSNDGRYTFGEKAMDFLTGVGADAVSSGISMATGGPLSTALMGGSAANQNLYETSQDENTTARQAAALATANGIAEAFFEHFSIERLLHFQNPTSTAQAVRTALAQAGVEASEEMATEIANTVSDIAIRRGNSERGREYQERLTNGEDPNSAARNTAISAVTQVLLSGLGGALSGGLHTGMAMYGNTLSNGMDLRRDIRNGITLEDIAGSIDTSTAEGQRVQNLANDIAQREASGTMASDTELGYLRNAIANAAEVAEQNEAKAVASQTAPVEDVASETTPQESIPERQAVTQMMNDVAAETASDTGDAFRFTNYYNSQRMTPGERIFNAEMSQDMASTFGEEGRKAFSALPAEEGVKAYREWAAHYNNMRFGMPIREGMSTTLSPEQISAAMRAGALDANRAYPQDTMKAMNRSVSKIKVNGVNAGVADRSGINYNSLTPQQKLRVDYTEAFVTKGLGMDVRYVQSEAVDGKYKGMNGSFQVINGRPTMTLDVNAGMNRESDWTGDITDIKTMLPVISHETTHFLEQYNPKLYKELSNTVLAALQNSGSYSKGMTINSIIEAERKRLNDTIRDENGNPVQHSQEDAIHELVARACEDMLSGDKKALDAFNSLDSQTKQTLWDHVKQVFDNIREFFSQMLSSYKSDSAEAKAIRQNMEEFEKIRDLWNKALNGQSAEENAKKAQDSTRKSENRPAKSARDSATRVGSSGERFSMRDTAEETKDLIAVHNLDEQKMKRLIKLSGLPAPSIAITKASNGWNKFGEISFVYGKDTIDPKRNKKNKIYGADAWTPTFPEVEYEIDDKVTRKAYNEVSKTANGMMPDKQYREALNRIGSLSDKLSRTSIDNAAEDAWYDLSLKAAYLASKGVKVEDIQKETVMFTPAEIAGYTQLIDELGDSLDDVFTMPTVDFRNKYEDALERAYNKIHEDRKTKLKDGRLKDYALTSIAKKAIEYKYRDTNAPKTVQDINAITEFVNEHADKEGFIKWIKSLFDGAVIGSGIRNGRDPYYADGRRRSWKQTHVPVTAENILKSMMRENKTGADAFFSVNGFIAVAQDSFKSIADVKRNSGRLLELDDSEFENATRAIGDKLFEIEEEIRDPNLSNTFTAREYAGEAITDAIRKHRTVRGIDTELRNWGGLNIKDDTAQRVLDLTKEAASLPTKYFEAKPERIVGFDEVKTAVVPADVDSEIMDWLNDNGIPVSTYERGNDADRTKALNAVDKVQFSTRDNKDSTGRTVPKAMLDYMKNSKMRDSEGRLIPMYHGTENANFSVFDPAKSDDGTSLFFTDDSLVAGTYLSGDPHGFTIDTPIDENDEYYEDLVEGFVDFVSYASDGQWAASDDGLTLTDDKGNEHTFKTANEAKEYFRRNVYASGMYTVYLNLENPLIVEANGASWNAIASDNDPNIKVYEYLEVENDSGRYSYDGVVNGEKISDHFVTAEEIENDLGKDIADAIRNGATYITDVAVGEDGKYVSNKTREYAQEAKANGYDGVIFRNIVDIGEYGEDRRPSTVAIAFSSNQVKSVYNENPTGDSDIRYSTRDSSGRDLTTEQAEYFRDSKARDAEGRLLTLYHGTASAGFTEFRGSVWLTTSKRDADSYGGNWEGKAFDPDEKPEVRKTTGKTYPVGEHMRFESKEDRDAFLKSYPDAESYLTEREYIQRQGELDSDLDADDYDERSDELQRLRRRSEQIERAYARYERNHSASTTIGAMLEEPSLYSLNDFKRAWTSIDREASFDDEFDNYDSDEEYRDAIADRLRRYITEENADDPKWQDEMLRLPVKARIPDGRQGEIFNSTNNRTYELYANVVNPFVFDNHGRGSEGNGTFHRNIEKAMADPQYDGVIALNARVGQHQDLGTVVVVKNSDQVKLASNQNPTADNDIRFSQRDVDMSGTLEEFMDRMDNRFLDRLADLDGEENAQLRQDLEDAYRANLEWAISEMQRRMDSAVGAEKKKAKKRLDALRARKNQRIDEVIADFREKRFRERVKRSERKAQQELLRRARRLAKKKGDPNFRAQVDALIGDLDLVASGIRSDTRSKLEEIKKQVEAQSELDPDYAKYEAPKYADLIGRLGKKHISQMKIEDIVQLTESIVALEHSKRTADREIKEGVGRTFGHYGKVAVEQQSRIKGINYKNEIGAQLGKYKLNMLNPVRAFSLIDGYQRDGVFTYFGKQLNDGQTKAAQFRMDVEKMFQDIDNNPKLVNDFAKQNIEIDTLEGKKKISKGMRIALYLHLQNAENVKHIAFGGITIPNERLYSRGKYAEAYAAGETVHLSEWIPGAKGESVFSEINRKNDAAAAAAIRKITDQMTPEELEYAKIAEKFFNETTKNAINEVSLELNGYEKATVEHYFPISTNKNFLQSSYDGLVKDGTLEGMGMLKERTGSRLPIYLEDVSQVVLRQKNNTALYYGLAVPIRNFTRFYNYTGGERLERSVKASVGKAWNKPGLNYIDNVLNDLQFGRQTQRSITDAMKSVYAGTTLNLNLGVAIKQSASYPFAASVIGWGPLAKAARHVVSKADREYMDSITPWGYMRRTGFSGTEMGEVAKQRTGIDNNRFIQRTKTALDLIRRVDVKTTEVLFFACEEYVKEKYPDLEVRGEEYNRKLAEVYNETLQRTQPSYDVMQRNEFLRSQNDLAKIFGAFKTQTFNMGGEVIDAWSRWRAYSEYAKTDSSYKEAKREAAKAFGNTIAATIVAQGMLVVLSAAANAVLHKMRDYRDEKGEITAESLAKKILKDFGTSFAGLTMGGSEAQDFALALLGDGKWYDIDYPGLTLVNDFASATVDFRKAASKAVETGNEQDMQKASAKMAKLIMQMFKLKGVPSQNLYNIVNAIYLWSTDYKNGQLGSFEAGQGLFGLQDTSPSKDQYAKQALDAYKNGDTKKGDRALEKAGESAIKKEIGGRQEEAAQFLKESGFGDTVNRKLWEGAGWKLKNYDKNMK